MHIFQNNKLNSKTYLVALFIVYLGGALSVFSCIPYYTNIRHLYSPTAAFPLFFVSVADALIPNNGFNIPLYKVIVLHLMGGLPGVILFLVASFLYRTGRISVASVSLYVLLSIFSLKYFYDSFYIVQWHSFFYWMMCTANFTFSILCVYFYLKNKAHGGVRENLYFHTCLLFWLVWCAFPRFDEIILL